LVLLLGIGITACASETGSDEKTSSIKREETPDSRFKPAELEDAVDDLISGIEAKGLDEDYSVGVVLKELQNFWRPVVVGANRAISELEVVGSVQGSTKEAQVDEQIEFVGEQIDLGVKGMAIAPHGDDLLDVLAEYSDTDAPIVTIDTDLPDSERAIYIGTDNKAGGTTGGETLVDLLDGDKGRVIVLGNTDEAWRGGLDRTLAAADVLEEAGNEVQVLHSLWDAEEELAQLLEAIEDDSTGEPLVGMLGVFANAHALGTAALEADLDDMPVIVAFDFEPDTLSYMEDGVIAATHVQRQYYMGYMSVYVLASINAVGLKETKKTLDNLLIDGFHLDTGLDVIRAKDLDEYNSFVDDLGI
jgi:ribose transport system substrate-binding protein